MIDLRGEWKRIYHELHRPHRQLVGLAIRYTWLRHRLALPFPIRFSLLASLVSFSSLAVLPAHPMTIPTALGAGLSIALMIFTIKASQKRPQGRLKIS